MYISSSSSYSPYTYSSPFTNSSSSSSNSTTNTSTVTTSTPVQNQTLSGNTIDPYLYSNPYSNSPFSQQPNYNSSSYPSMDQLNSQIDAGIVNSMMSIDNSSLTSNIPDTSWMNSFDQLSSMTSSEFSYMNNNPALSASGQSVLYTTNLMQSAYSQASQLFSNNTPSGQLINQIA